MSYLEDTGSPIRTCPIPPDKTLKRIDSFCYEDCSEEWSESFHGEIPGTAEQHDFWQRESRRKHVISDDNEISWTSRHSSNSNNQQQSLHAVTSSRQTKKMTAQTRMESIDQWVMTAHWGGGADKHETGQILPTSRSNRSLRSNRRRQRQRRRSSFLLSESVSDIDSFHSSQEGDMPATENTRKAPTTFVPSKNESIPGTPIHHQRHEQDNDMSALFCNDLDNSKDAISSSMLSIQDTSFIQSASILENVMDSPVNNTRSPMESQASPKYPYKSMASQTSILDQLQYSDLFSTESLDGRVQRCNLQQVKTHASSSKDNSNETCHIEIADNIANSVSDTAIYDPELPSSPVDHTNEDMASDADTLPYDPGLPPSPFHPANNEAESDADTLPYDPGLPPSPLHSVNNEAESDVDTLPYNPLSPPKSTESTNNAKGKAYANRIQPLHLFPTTLLQSSIDQNTDTKDAWLAAFSDDWLPSDPEDYNNHKQEEQTQQSLQISFPNSPNLSDQEAPFGNNSDNKKLSQIATAVKEEGNIDEKHSTSKKIAGSRLERSTLQRSSSFLLSQLDQTHVSSGSFMSSWSDPSSQEKSFSSYPSQTSDHEKPKLLSSQMTRVVKHSQNTADDKHDEKATANSSEESSTDDNITGHDGPTCTVPDSAANANSAVDDDDDRIDSADAVANTSTIASMATRTTMMHRPTLGISKRQKRMNNSISTDTTQSEAKKPHIVLQPQQASLSSLLSSTTSRGWRYGMRPRRFK